MLAFKGQNFMVFKTRVSENSLKSFEKQSFIKNIIIFRPTEKFPETDDLNILFFLIVLDPEHKITILLINYYHEQTWYDGDKTLVIRISDQIAILDPAYPFDGKEVF